MRLVGGIFWNGVTFIARSMKYTVDALTQLSLTLVVESGFSFRLP